MMVQRKRLSSGYQTWPFKETMKKVGNPINLPFRDDILPFRKNNKKNSDIGDGLLGFPHWLNDFSTDMPIYLDDFPASRLRLYNGGKNASCWLINVWY